MSARDGVRRRVHGSRGAAALTGFELGGVVWGEPHERRFTVRPPSRLRSSALWLLSALCAVAAAALIRAVVTGSVVEPLWRALALLDAAGFILVSVLLVLEGIRVWVLGTVVLASSAGVRVIEAHETLTRRLGLTRWQNLLAGGAHRFAWDGIERFALHRRIEAVFTNGKRRRLAIHASLPLVHWLNDMLVLYTKGEVEGVPPPPA
jgi:hypothetical protein